MAEGLPMAAMHRAGAFFDRAADARWGRSASPPAAVLDELAAMGLSRAEVVQAIARVRAAEDGRESAVHAVRRAEFSRAFEYALMDSAGLGGGNSPPSDSPSYTDVLAACARAISAAAVRDGGRRSPELEVAEARMLAAAARYAALAELNRLVRSVYDS